MGLGRRQAAPFGNPSKASTKIYGMALSTSADCSNASVVDYDAIGIGYDFKKSPALFSGTIHAGTYQWAILDMSSLLSCTPAATVGSCAAGTTYVRNFASGGGQFTPGTPNASNLLDYSALIAFSGANSQDISHPEKVLPFFSTGSAGNGQTGIAFQRPTAAASANGITLGAPFVISDTGSTGTFVVNFDGQLDGGQTPCDLGPPTFTFR